MTSPRASPSGGLDLRDDRVEPVAAAPCHHDLEAVARQAPRDRRTDAGAATGHQGEGTGLGSAGALTHHLAENRRTAGRCVCAVTSAPLNTSNRGCQGVPSRRAAASRSLGVVTLNARVSPSTTSTRSPSRSTRPASSVALLAEHMSTLEHVAPETLRRLHGPQRRPVGRRHDEPVGVHLLDRVDDRRAGHHGHGSGRHRGDDPIEDRARREAACRVVHEDDLDVGRERGQPGGHGVTALGAAHDDGARRRPTRAHGIRRRRAARPRRGGRQARRRPPQPPPETTAPPAGRARGGARPRGARTPWAPGAPDVSRSRPRRR